jgi:hypothetical protein
MKNFMDSEKIERMIATIQSRIEAHIDGNGMITDNEQERIMQQVFIDNDATAGEMAAVEGEF